MAEELDPMSGLVGKEKTTEPIKTPKAKKATTPPPPVTPNPFAELGLLGKTFEDKTGGFTEEGFTSTGIANTMQGQYGSYLKDGFDLRYSDGENTAGQNQGAWTQVGSGIGRFAGKVAIEVLKMPGYIGGMGGSAIDGMFGTNLTDSDNFVGSVADNAWINAFESLDEGVKNALPVYMTDAVKNGSLWDNISSTSFWASEGADGMAYMASMFFPGAAVKALGAGAKIAGGMAKGYSGASKLASKFIPFVKPTNFHGASKALFNVGVKGSSIDLAAATGMSTMFEAAAEAGGTMDHLKESLLPKLQSGEITQEEYDSTIANAGKDVFNANLGILIGPNLLMNKMLLGRFKPTKSLNIKDGVVQSAKQTTKQQLGTIGKTLATNVASEGLFEEGLQGTVEGMITEKAEKGERYDLDEFFGDLGGAYMDMLGSTEGQKAIFLGSVMGGGMGIASHLKQRKANAKFEDGVAGAMAEHTNTLYDFADIYKTDNQGKPVLNKETSRPEIDPIKFDKSLTGLAEMLELTETLTELNEAGKKDAYDAMLGSVHLNLAIAFADLENGEQGFREILEDRKAFFDMNNPDQKFDGENISSEEYITKIESLAKQAKKDKDVYNEFITPNLQLNKENEFSEEELSEEEFVGEAEAFQSKAEAAFINANHTIRSIDKSLSKVNAQISELERVLNTEEQSTEEGSPKESGMISTLKEKKKNLTEQKKRIAKQIDAFSSPENIRNEFKKHLDKLVKIKNVIKSETEKEKKREEEGGHPLDPKVDNAKDEAVLDAVLAQARQDNSITPELNKRVEAKRNALKGAKADENLSPEQSQNRKEKESITEARSEFDNITDEDVENAVGLDAFMQTEEEGTPAKTKEEPVVASPLDALTGLKVDDSLSSNEKTKSADTTEDTTENVSAASSAVSDAIAKRKEEKEAAAKKKDEAIKSTPVGGQVEDDFSSSDPYTSVNRDMVLYKVTSKGLILANANPNAPIMSFEQADAAGLKYDRNQKGWGVLLDENFNPIDSPSKKDSDYKVDQDFVNSGGVKPGDSISYSVRPDSDWNGTGTATSANLVIELKHDKSGKVIGILPAYKAKKGHEESFKELRDSIYAEYLAHDKNSGELISKTKTKVEEVRPGRVHSTGTKSNPLNVLTTEQPFILTTVVEEGGVAVPKSNDISQFKINSEDIFTDNLIAAGRSYMLIQAPNGSWIPYQVNPTKLSSVEGTKEKIEAILDSITPENFIEKRRELREIVYIKELNDVEYGKAKSSDNTFGIPGKKLHGLPLDKFKEYLFDELNIMDKLFNIDAKQVNNPGYNQMLANEGRIKTDLNPMKHFHSATVRVSKTAVSAETKAVEKKTVTKPTKAEKKEDIASLPSTKVEVVTASPTTEVEAKKADTERRRQEGKEIQLFEDKDKKGRIYTFFSTTKEKDGLTKTTFTFNRSDKPSTQRNKGSVPTDIALGNKYTIPKQTKNADGSMSNQIPEDTIVHSVLEIREADGKVGATVMFQDKNDSTKRWKVDIVLEINAKYDAELDALQPTQPTSGVKLPKVSKEIPFSYGNNKELILNGDKTITSRNFKFIPNLKPGESGIQTIDGVDFKVTYHGELKHSEVKNKVGVEYSEGEAFAKTTKGAPTEKATVDFIKGKGTKHIYQFSRIQQTSEVEVKKADIDNLLSKEKTIKIGRYTPSARFSDRVLGENVNLEVEDALASIVSFTRGPISKEQISQLNEVLDLFSPVLSIYKIDGLIYKYENEVANFTEIIEGLNRIKQDKISQPTQQTSEVESKKADIERRRQEKLEELDKRSIKKKDGSYELQIPNSSTTMRLNPDLSFKEAGIYTDVTKQYNVPKTTEGATWVKFDGQAEKNSKADYKKTVKDAKRIIEINNKQAISVNAKYDAELAALESTPQTSEVESKKTSNLELIKIQKEKSELIQEKARRLKALDNPAIEERRKEGNTKGAEILEKNKNEKSKKLDEEYDSRIEVLSQKELEITNPVEFAAQNKIKNAVSKAVKESTIGGQGVISAKFGGQNTIGKEIISSDARHNSSIYGMTSPFAMQPQDANSKVKIHETPPKSITSPVKGKTYITLSYFTNQDTRGGLNVHVVEIDSNVIKHLSIEKLNTLFSNFVDNELFEGKYSRNSFNDKLLQKENYNITNFVDKRIREIINNSIKPTQQTSTTPSTKLNRNVRPAGLKKGGTGLKLKSKEDNKGEAYKAKTKSTEAQITKEEIAWFKKNFPQVDIQVLEDLRSITAHGVDAWGMFKNAMVSIHEKAPEGTAFHEAFHAVFRMMLSPEQRSALLAEAAERFDFDQKEYDALRKAHPRLSENALTMLYYEEKLADSYQLYQTNKGLTKSLGSKIQSLFKRIFDFFMGTKNNMLNIDQMFDKMSRGGFKNADIIRSTASINPVYSVRKKWSSNKVEARVNLVNDLMLKTVKSEYMENPEDYKELQKTLSRVLTPKNPNGSVYNQVATDLINDAYDAQDEGNITTSEELFDLVDEMFTYEITEEGGIEFKSYKPFMYDLTNNLRKFDIKVNATREQFEEQGEQLDEDGNLIENWQQNSVTVNPKANLSGELKMLFSQIPDGKDDLGYDKYHDGNKVFNTLLSLITNSDSVSTMLEKLDNAKENHSFINTINSKLISDPKLKSQLFQIAQKSNNNAKVVFQTITFDKEDNQVTESRLVNANENTVEQVITDNLYNQFSSSNILDENLEVKEEGLVTNDIEKLDELLTFFKRPVNRSLESASEEQVKELYSILNKHNLVLDKAHIEKLGKNKKNFVKLITSYKGLLTIINKGTNPFISEKKALKRITSLIQLVEPNYFQSSYRNMANETVQSVVAPNFLSKVLTKLSGSNVSEDTVADHREEVFENLRNSDAFLSTAPILRPRGAKNSYVADNNGVFEFATLSGIRKKGITKGKSYTSMTKGDLAESLLTTFHNSGSASHAWYSLPILSDAPTMTVVKLKKLNHADVVADLHFVAHQEYQRILDVKAKMKDGGTLIKNRDSENGLKFHFITNLVESDFTAANSRDLIKAKIESFLAEQVEEFSKEVQSFELSKNISSPASIKSFVENDFLAKTQLISLTSGDVAYYKSTVDFFKRNKQINSPGMYINEAGTFTYTGEDTKLQGKTINVRPTFDSVFLTDTTPAAPFRADLKEALIKSGMSETKAETKAKNYDKVEESDAQAYITLDRWVEIQIGMGRYDNAMHESVSRLKSGKSTTDDISLVMQPIKPFYFGHVNIEGSVVPMQNKNSEYVLLPELANKSTKLKKLLDFMEENKVSSAQFESAVKVGLHSKVEIENLTSKTPVVSLKNSDYRVQMETPAHFSDAQSLLGSQIRKLILGDLNLEAMYGDKMSGQDLINKVDEILSKTISEAMKETLEEVTDPTTLNNILKEEVLNRDLGERYLKALELDENGDPTLQYYHPFLSQQAQSLFNSVFKTAIAKTKMNGGSLYNLSSFGFTEDLTIKFNKKTGGIDHVEAMVPASAIFGKNIPKEFLNEFGEIDITKVPEKMLRGMSYRIPTEDKYSMFNIKVVGFLPNSAAIMLPTGVTTVAGLDFDIDKMYNMFYNHKNGIPVESGMDSKAARDNYILDLYTLVKQHPSSLEASMTPGGFQTFESVVNDIKKRKGMAEDNLNPASVSSNLEIFARNMAGKALIGIFANHNASHAILQHGDIEIIDGLINFDGDTNSSISEVTDLKGGLITRNIAEFLAAVVDNANDPLAGFSNVNTYTADVISMFLHNGRSIETALAFMNQPIIIDYVERYFNYGASKQAEAKALEELKVEKPEDLKKLPSQYSTSTLLRGINGKTKEAYTNAEQAILTDFLKFKMVASEVSNLVNAVKTGDSGTGPTMGHNEAKIRQWNRVKMESKYIVGHADLMNDTTKSFVNYYETGIKQANAEINKAAKFPFNSGMYLTSKDSIESNVASTNLNVNDLNNINDSVMSYIAASHEFFNKEAVEEVLKNLPGRLAKYQKENPNSEFSKITKYLTVKVDPNTNTRVIEYSTIANDSLQQDNSSKAWESMLLSDNVEDKQMALDLFKYNFGRSGFKFTRSSFAHIAPVEIYDYIPGFKNHIDAKLNEFSYDHSIVSTEAFTNQYVANNFANLNYIPIFAYNVKSVGKGVNTSENVITNKQGQVTSVTFDKEEGRQFTKYDPAIKSSYALPFIKLNTSVKVGDKNKRVSTLFKHNVEASTGTTEIVYDAVITPKEGTVSYEVDKIDFEFRADVKSEASTQLEKFDISDENNAISLGEFLKIKESGTGLTEEEDPFKKCKKSNI